MPQTSAGIINLSMGMNSYTNPLLLNDTQCAEAFNVSFRGGFAKTRPSFVDSGVALPKQKFRGAGRWSLNMGDCIVAVFGQEVFVIDIQSRNLVGPVAIFETASETCFMTQVDKYMVVQNNEDLPVVLEEKDGQFFKLVPEKIQDPSYDEELLIDSISIPTGTIGVYAHGRMHMVPKLIPNTVTEDRPEGIDGRDSIVSGDILIAGEEGTPLRFTENEYLSEGGANAMPMEIGFVEALGVLRNAQTGTGLGNIIAFGRNGSCAFDFSIARSLWKEQGISAVLFFGPGCISPRSVLGVNDDLVYRGLDGLRTIKYSVSTVAGSSGALSDTPISQPIEKYLAMDKYYLKKVSSGYADNRLFLTTANENPSGQEPEGGVARNDFRALASVDTAASYYNGVSGFGAFEGLWTGLKFTQILHALIDKEWRVFAFSSANKLYFLNLNTGGTDPRDTKIKSRIITKSFFYENLVNIKQVMYLDLWVSDITMTTKFAVWYRPHGYPLWAKLAERIVEIPDGSLPQNVHRLRFSLDEASETCNPITQEALRTSTAFQFAIDWEGSATIERIISTVDVRMEQPPDVCDEEGVVLEESELAGQKLDGFDYQIPEGEVQ